MSSCKQKMNLKISEIVTPSTVIVEVQISGMAWWRVRLRVAVTMIRFALWFAGLGCEGKKKRERRKAVPEGWEVNP